MTQEYRSKVEDALKMVLDEIEKQHSDKDRNESDFITSVAFYNKELSNEYVCGDNQIAAQKP